MNVSKKVMQKIVRPISNSSNEATYIYMHAGQPARVLPRRGGLPELTEVVLEVRLRQARRGGRADERCRWGDGDQAEDVLVEGFAGRR